MISDPDDIAIETIQTERKVNQKKNAQPISELWNNFKKVYICVTGIPETGKVRLIQKKILKDSVENFVNLMKTGNPQIQDPQKLQAKTTRRHTKIKWLKTRNKGKILKAFKAKKKRHIVNSRA